jgi:hypothetical protein
VEGDLVPGRPGGRVPRRRLDAEEPEPGLLLRLRRRRRRAGLLGRQLRERDEVRLRGVGGGGPARFHLRGFALERVSLFSSSLRSLRASAAVTQAQRLLEEHGPEAPLWVPAAAGVVNSAMWFQHACNPMSAHVSVLLASV